MFKQVQAFGRKAVSTVGKYCGKAAAVVTGTVVSVSAMAQEAGDPGVNAINELSTKATAYTAAAFSVAVLVAGAFWGIRMMKKSFGAAK